ncbi:hypothetical protein EST38_g12321 [Candolleomyces aberdarensis]|uniref:Uncharacterized protein n=1 Tax=Candolleomyces aberdarensis TaxID=2316362 RepID=A0A4Q2D4Z6_9AGAR|nr:hypothetical protein EST38_g12321 [Candolleomyces aberdarensis]
MAYWRRRISNTFLAAWKHAKKPFPTIRNIFYVVHSSADALAHLSRFSNYSRDVWSRDLLDERIFKRNIPSFACLEADGYASRKGNKDKLKSIILNHVVLGRTHLTRQVDHNMQHAPDIYNSVTGATVEEGGTLQYHEAVVYREDAMCASAVIFYQ